MVNTQYYSCLWKWCFCIYHLLTFFINTCGKRAVLPHPLVLRQGGDGSASNSIPVLGALPSGEQPVGSGIQLLPFRWSHHLHGLGVHQVQGQKMPNPPLLLLCVAGVLKQSLIQSWAWNLSHFLCIKVQFMVISTTSELSICLYLRGIVFFMDCLPGKYLAKETPVSITFLFFK